MRYALLSDIHSNLEALNVVLAEVKRLGADEIICLGDLVGYGANPNEIVEVAIGKGFCCLVGNHDLVACGMEEPDNFNPWARHAVLWTRAMLTEANKQYLKGLPFQLELSAQAVAAHGSLESVDEYIMDTQTARANFRLLKEKGKSVLFFGHSHYRVTIVKEEDKLLVDRAEELILLDKNLYLINPGSVGQPRDGDPRAAFAIYNVEAGLVTFHRLQYDIDTASRKILEAGLSPALAQRLFRGM